MMMRLTCERHLRLADRDAGHDGEGTKQHRSLAAKALTSSRTRILDLRRSALAMHRSWRWPVERLDPPSFRGASSPACSAL